MNTPSLQKHGEGMRDCETLGGTANNFSEDLCVSFPKRRETESFHGKLPYHLLRLAYSINSLARIKGAHILFVFCWYCRTSASV